MIKLIACLMAIALTLTVKAAEVQLRKRLPITNNFHMADAYGRDYLKTALAKKPLYCDYGIRVAILNKKAVDPVAVIENIIIVQEIAFDMPNMGTGQLPDVIFHDSFSKKSYRQQPD